MPSSSVETTVLLTAVLVLMANLSSLFRRYLVLSRGSGSGVNVGKVHGPIVAKPAHE